MYKYIGTSLMGLFLLMMFPSGVQTDTHEGLQMYGLATLEYQDEYGNSMFTQTVHNQLFDEGEQEILTQVFADSVGEKADNVQIASMCVAEGTPLAQSDETATAAFFVANNTLSAQNNCIEADFDTTTVIGTAFTPANVFNAPTHVANGDSITSIGICSGENLGSPHSGCSGTLFAVVDTSDVTLATGESVTITYTFDISSAGN